MTQSFDVARSLYSALLPLEREQQLQAMERTGRMLGIDLGVDLVRNLQSARQQVEALEQELGEARNLLRKQDPSLPLTEERVLEANGVEWQRVTTLAALLGVDKGNHSLGVWLRRLVVAGRLEREGIGRGAVYRRKQ